MPRYKITEHQTGWQTLENFVDAKDEDDAHEKYNDSEYVNNQWKIVDEEYRNVDVQFELVKDYPPKNSWGMIKPSESWIEGYNKWKKEQKK